MCPWGGRLVDGRAGLGERARMVGHCLAVETPKGLVLVDTGLGMRDTLAAEREAADLRKGFIARRRYRPMQWDEGVRWRTYKPQGEIREGFECVKSLQGVQAEILLVPLAGHTGRALRRRVALRKRVALPRGRRVLLS
jgi:hypothetical protein